MTEYTLRPRITIGRVALAACLAILGVALIAFQIAFLRAGWLGFFGVLLVAVAALMVVQIIVAARRGVVRVRATETALEARGDDFFESVPWSDIERVSIGEGEKELHVYRSDGSRTTWLAPSGWSHVIDKLAPEISSRLDDEQGYRQFT